MKNRIYPFLFLLLSLGVSCSSDKDTAPAVTPVFPESQQVELTPGDIGEISFDANMDWRLTSNKQWFKLIDGQATFQSLTGKPGKQTVQLTVTDGAYGFAEDEAAIELTMGGESRVFVGVKRPAKERVVKMFTTDASMNSVPIDEFVDNTIGRSEYLGFEANFDWKVDVESLPTWLIDYLGSQRNLCNLNGEANQVTKADRMSIVDIEVSERYIDRTDFITIREVDGDYTYRFPVSAPGIETGKLRWLHSSLELRGGWLWSEKGQYLLREPVGGTITPSDGPAVCKVLTRNLVYTCHFIEWVKNAPKEVAPEDEWIKIVEDVDGSITLAAAPYEGKSARKLYLFVVPENTTVDYASYFDRSGVFTFQSEGFGLQLEQMAKPCFEIHKQINSMKFELMPDVEKVAEAEAEAIAGLLGLKTLNNIYERVFTADEWAVANKYHIAPQGLVEDWGKYELFDSRGKSLGNKPVGWSSAEFWAIGSVYDAAYNATRSLVIDKRVAYDAIAEECLYVVIRGSANKDIGTFVIRKE